MSTYTLFSTEKELLELALNALIQTYDQYKIKDPKPIEVLRRRIRESTSITLTTRPGK